MDPPNDAATLIGRIASGDRVAFERLYRAYDRRVFGYLRTMLGPGEAEDALADVMLAVWRSAGRYAGHGEARSWIFAIASNVAKKRLRAAERGARAKERLLHVVPVPERTPDDAILEFEEAERIGAALARLSDDHREVLWLTYKLGFSQDEIARVTGVPRGTVKSRVFHAKTNLKAVLETPTTQRASG